MANPLFYRKIVPLNRDTHRGLRLKPAERPLAYAREAHLLPAVISEFGAAMHELPIAFLPGASQPAAVFVTGLQPGRNVFIAESGRWTGSYVPAYLRRYPFIIGDVPDADPILCIDEAFEGLDQSEGSRLFSEAGEAEPSVTQAIGFANSYRAAATRTDVLSATLQRMRLFRSVTLDAKLPDGNSTVIHGLLVVDEEALAALPDEQFMELRRQDFLKPIHAHLLSLSVISRLAVVSAPPADATLN